jgi:PAS domain S-box-containing protein/putative nucleotidyltransferase with HDIG domain
MERAMNTGTVTITGMVTLAIETDFESQPGFLMYVPVYKNDMPLNTPGERREAIDGVVVGGFRMQDLIQSIFPNPTQNISFQIYDDAEISADTLFYDSNVSPDANTTVSQPLLTCQKTLNFYGHQWTLAFKTTPVFEAAIDRSTPKGIFTAGLLLSFLTFFYLKTLVTTGDRALSLAQKMTSALRESEQKYRYMTENISDVIWSVDLEGNLTYMSPAIEKLIGYTAEEVMAMPITDYTVQEDYDALTAKLTEELAKTPAERDHSVIMPVRHRTKDNHFVHTEFSASWLLDEQGNLIGVQGTTRDITERLKAEGDLLQAYDATIEGWAYALDLKDEETEEHSQRVTRFSLHIARKMGIKDEELVHVKRGALLHDIGKMGIPDSILLKPGPLTDEEWVVMRKHPFYAYEMLSWIDYLRPALDIPYCHHEKWDGSGYPRGLKGTAIPLPARIFAVVDVYDALTSDRPYRKAWSVEDTLALIKKDSGSHFDPEVVNVFLQEINSFD